MADQLTPEYVAKVAEDFRARAVAAAESEGDRLLAASQAIVPVVSGKLRASGRRTDAVTDSSTGEISVSVIYGGTPEVPYAARAHEDPTGQHPKFLERPLMDMESEILERIAEKVKV